LSKALGEQTQAVVSRVASISKIASLFLVTFISLPPFFILKINGFPDLFGDGATQGLQAALPFLSVFQILGLGPQGFCLLVGPNTHHKGVIPAHNASLLAGISILKESYFFDGNEAAVEEIPPLSQGKL